jgi:hypothetical protein
VIRSDVSAIAENFGAICELSSLLRIGAPIQHLHFTGDDFGGIAISTALILPLAGFDAALKVGL